MTTTSVPARSIPLAAVAQGAVTTTLVGAAVPITGLLINYPVLGGLAIRYGGGALVLYVWLRRKGRRLPRPSPRDLLGLAGMIGPGMLGFNAVVLEAQRYAQPGFVAAMIGAAPLILALLVPAVHGRRPGLFVVIGALVVTAGEIVLSGGGSWHGPGLLLAALAVVGEVLFTVSGAGVARRLGVLETSVLACGLAAIIGAVSATVVGAAVGGPAAWPMPTPVEWIALLAVGAVTLSIGMVCWYSSVSTLGADRAGVLIGLMPVSGFAMSALLGTEPVTITALSGALLVGIGAATGLRPNRQPTAIPPR